MPDFDNNSSQHKPCLSDEQKLAWLRLIRSQNVGPVTFRQLINKYGSAEQALEALPHIALRGGAKNGSRICTREQAELEWTKAKQYGAHLVALGELYYPELLAQTDAPPPLIYLKGDLTHLQKPALAIVGSRNASALGHKFTHKIVQQLALENFIIVSGLARGIDTAAHQASLTSGTIAVVAGGIDYFYPPENQELQNAIGSKGVLVSENPPGFHPRAQDFPRRNRIISGLSLGTLVVEANRRSGSLITARLAGEQGRHVFAIPGHPMDPRADGTNHLIREGAILVRSASDVLEILDTQLELFSRKLPPVAKNTDLSDEIMTYENVDLSDREQLIQAMSTQMVSVDDLIHVTGLPAANVMSILLELDLAGRLERQPGSMVALIS